MKIDELKPPPQLEPVKTTKDKRDAKQLKRDSGAAKALEDSADKLQLSQNVEQAMKLRTLLESLPDMREDKVAEIKARIDAGQYQVDSRAVAEKMLRKKR